MLIVKWVLVLLSLKLFSSMVPETKSMTIHIGRTVINQEGFGELGFNKVAQIVNTPFITNPKETMLLILWQKVLFIRIAQSLARLPDHKTSKAELIGQSAMISQEGYGERLRAL